VAVFAGWIAAWTVFGIEGFVGGLVALGFIVSGESLIWWKHLIMSFDDEPSPPDGGLGRFNLFP